MKTTIIIFISLVAAGFAAKAQTDQISASALPLKAESQAAEKVLPLRGVRGVSNENQVTQTLEDYFQIATENNPSLQAQYKDFEAALQKVSQVSSLPDPTFSFGYFISPVETRVGPQRAKFSLSQMFPWFGTLEAQSDAASLMADANIRPFSTRATDFITAFQKHIIR